MGLLPLGGEFGPFLVVVVVRQILACVGVPTEGPEAVEMDLVTHGGRQRVHKDSSAEPFGREVFSLPVSVRKMTNHSIKNRKHLLNLARHIMSLSLCFFVLSFCLCGRGFIIFHNIILGVIARILEIL